MIYRRQDTGSRQRSTEKLSQHYQSKRWILFWIKEQNPTFVLTSRCCRKTGAVKRDRKWSNRVSPWEKNREKEGNRFYPATDRQLDNVAINDVLPLKAARRDATASLYVFGASDTRDLISMVTFTFTMRRHLFPHVWQRLVGFGFRVQRVESTMQNLRRAGENSDPILSRL